MTLLTTCMPSSQLAPAFYPPAYQPPRFVPCLAPMGELDIGGSACTSDSHESHNGQRSQFGPIAPYDPTGPVYWQL
jgi:hypothetical protein